MTLHSLFKPLAALCAIILVAVYGFSANEASKEMYYLCGNFEQGEPLNNVIRQLDTANLSTYTIKQNDQQQWLSFSSAINLYWNSCDIRFDKQNMVQSVSYQ